MLRKWLRNHLPNRKNIRNHSSASIFHYYLLHSNVWHLNCTSVSRGTAIGLFIAFIPIPFQMLLAGFFAVLFRANLPIAIAMTWITNPFTFIPINYFIYWVGSKVLGKSVPKFTLPTLTGHFENASQFWTSFLKQAILLGKSYFVGLPIVAIGVSILGYLTVRIIWYATETFSNHARKNNK